MNIYRNTNDNALYHLYLVKPYKFTGGEYHVAESIDGKSKIKVTNPKKLNDFVLSYYR
jgi:hypothetical protein